MKPFLFALLFAFTASYTTAQKTVRYGAYLDHYRFGTPALEIGALMTYSPNKWSRLRVEAGVMGAQQTLFAEIGADARVYYRRMQTITPTITITPSVHVSKRLSLELNAMNFLRKGFGADKARFFVMAPGIALRYNRVEIRGRYIIPDGAPGMGLTFFIR